MLTNTHIVLLYPTADVMLSVLPSGLSTLTPGILPNFRYISIAVREMNTSMQA